MAFGSFFRRVRNTRAAGGRPPSAGVERPGVTEARKLLQSNPGADKRDLVDQLVKQRQGKSFRGIPSTEVDKITDRAKASRQRRRK